MTLIKLALGEVNVYVKKAIKTMVHLIVLNVIILVIPVI
jgi:hypothetical protein